MDENHQPVPLPSHPLCGKKREAEALRLSSVQFFVRLRKAGRAGNAPPPRAAENDISQSDGIVLKRIDVRRQAFTDARNALPPIVVIAAHEDLFPRQSGKFLHIEERLFQVHRPADVAGDEDDVALRCLFRPVRLDLIEVPYPISAEHFHRLIRSAGYMQIADGKNFQGSPPWFFLILAHSARRSN